MNSIPTQTSRPSKLWLACGLALGVFASTVTATPYASGVSNNAGTISFVLNEAADSVKVIFDGGVSTNDLGALAKGTHSFALGGATTYDIVVSKSSGPGYRWNDGGTVTTSSGTWRSSSIIEISDTNSSLLVFNSPRGIAINRRVNSPYFGRVYVCNSADPAGGSTTNVLGVIRNNASADGIYLLKADLTDALGQDDTARTGGLNWTTSAESPGRLHLGPDDMLYICDRGSVTSAGLYMTDPDVSASSGTNILVAFSGATQFPIGTANTHGRIDCVDVIGSLNTSNLRIYMQDVDLQPDKTTSSSTKRNSIWRSPSADLLSWAKLPYTNNFDLTGDKFTSPQNHQNAAYATASDYEKGTNSYYYVNIFKDDGNTFWVFDASFSGGGLFNARSAGDTALSGFSLGLSPDQKYVAIGTRLNGHVIVYPTDSGLVPLHARRVFVPIGPGGGANTQPVREVRFDAANNMYVLQQSRGLRVFSPGGASIATTSYDGSATSFSVQFGPAINPQPTNRVNNAGTTASFSITADGTAPLSYRWLKNGTPLADGGNVSGATGTALSLTGVGCVADAGNYQVVVSNAVGVVTSLVATLTVNDPFIATAGQPLNQTNLQGTTAMFTVTPSGSPTFLYQWKRGGIDLTNGPTGFGSTISGATTAALTIANVSQADATNGSYTVAVSSTAPCASNVVTSAARTLKVISPALITGQQVLLDGSFELTFTGPDGQTYKVLVSADIAAPLASWAQVSSGTFGAGPVVFTDFGAIGEPIRFYVIVSP